MKKTASALRKPVVEISQPQTAALVPANSNLPARVAEAITFIKQIDGAPMRDRILVARANPKEEITGVRDDGSTYKIIIPDIAQETQGVGMVVAVGSGHYLDGKNVPIDVEPGQIVFFNKYSGTETKVGKFTLLRLREEEIEFRANGQKCMELAKEAKRGRA